MKWLVGGILLLALLCTSVHAQGCIANANGARAADADCDGVADILDNCPQLQNPEQRDMNRDGKGDACDVAAIHVTIDPDNTLREGEIAQVIVRVLNTNNLPLETAVRVRNNGLGFDQRQSVPIIPSGETGIARFWIKIPKCNAAGSYRLNITATSGSTISTVTATLTVQKGTVCGTPSSPLDSTIITMLEPVSVDRGESTSIPIHITNLGNQTSYDLTIESMDAFGTWRIEPADHLRIDAGESKDVTLFLQTEANAEPGMQHVQLAVTSGQGKTTIPLQIYVRAPISQQQSTPTHLLINLLFIVVLVALIVMAIIIAMRNRQEPQEPRRETKPVFKRSRKIVSVEPAEDQKETNY